MTVAPRRGALLIIALVLATAACSGSPSAQPATPPDAAANTSDVPLAADSLAPTTPTAPTTTTTTTLPPLPTVRLDVPDLPGGFATVPGLTGGFGREVYVIDSADDTGAGTYRDALSRGDRHIVFDPAMNGRTIALTREILADGSNITLDGSGVDVIVSGASTKFRGTNIIVAGMSYADLDAFDEEDALTFLDASTTQVVGLFGNVFAHAADGLVDFIWNRGNDVYATVCGNRFERHDKAMLVHSGRSGREGGTYHITLCQNVWSDVYQRAPYSRDALVHQYNSVFERYGKANGDGGGSKAGSAEVDSQHLLENNTAIPRRVGEQTFDGSTVDRPRTEWAGPHLSDDGAVRISGTLLETVDGITATENEQHPERVFDPPYEYRLAPANEATFVAVRATAGQCTPTGPDRIVPCAPLLLLERGGSLAVSVEGEVSSVAFELDGEPIDDVVAHGEGGWTATFASLTDGARTVRVIATTPDGRTVASDPVIVAVVS